MRFRERIGAFLTCFRVLAKTRIKVAVTDRGIEIEAENAVAVVAAVLILLFWLYW